MHGDRYQKVQTALGLIFMPIENNVISQLIEPECTRMNDMAKAWEQSGFNNSYFQTSACSIRRLQDDIPFSSSGNRSLATRRELSGATEALQRIYANKYAPLKRISEKLAVFRTVEETVKTAWLEVRDAIVVIGEVIDVYQKVMEILAMVFEAVLGPVIDVFGVVIDKVGTLRPFCRVVCVHRADQDIALMSLFFHPSSSSLILTDAGVDCRLPVLNRRYYGKGGTGGVSM